MLRDVLKPIPKVKAFRKQPSSQNEQHSETRYKRLHAYYINVAYSLVLVFRKHNEPH